MYIKYIVNYWSVCLYHDIHSKTKVIYFEQGLVARGGLCRRGVLSVPQNARWHFLTFFQNSWEFLVQILHVYYMFLSTLDCKFLFNYLQLWRSYAILSATIQRVSPNGGHFEHIMVVALIWRNFIKVADNWIKICSPAQIGMYNSHVKFGLEIPNRLGKISGNLRGRDSHTSDCVLYKVKHWLSVYYSTAIWWWCEDWWWNGFDALWLAVVPRVTLDFNSGRCGIWPFQQIRPSPAPARFLAGFGACQCSCSMFI